MHIYNHCCVIQWWWILFLQVCRSLASQIDCSLSAIKSAKLVVQWIASHILFFSSSDIKRKCTFASSDHVFYKRMLLMNFVNCLCGASCVYLFGPYHKSHLQWQSVSIGQLKGREYYFMLIITTPLNWKLDTGCHS